MGTCRLIGDAVTAAGLRLAGLDCVTPAATPEAVTGAFTRARAADAAAAADGAVGLVLITAELAALLPPGLLAAALAEQRPPTLVIADLRGLHAPPERAAALRRQLGMAE